MRRFPRIGVDRIARSVRRAVGHAAAPTTIVTRSVVPGSPAAVYDLVANARLRVAWLPELDAAAAPDRQLQAGDRFDGYSSLLLHRFVGASEVLAAEPLRHLEERVVIGARFVTRWDLVATDGGTAVTHTVEIEFPQGIFGPIERWILGRRLAILQRRGLARLGRRIDPTEG